MSKNKYIDVKRIEMLGTLCNVENYAKITQTSFYGYIVYRVQTFTT